MSKPKIGSQTRPKKKREYCISPCQVVRKRYFHAVLCLPNVLVGICLLKHQPYGLDKLRLSKGYVTVGVFESHSVL